MGDADRNAKAGDTDGSLGAGAADNDLPAVNFSTFIVSLSHSAFVHLGDAPDPDGVRGVNLPLARQTIDLLTLLQAKTKNNLEGPEERLLEQALYDLRLRYVEVSRDKAE